MKLTSCCMNLAGLFYYKLVDVVSHAHYRGAYTMTKSPAKLSVHVKTWPKGYKWSPTSKNRDCYNCEVCRR